MVKIIENLNKLSLPATILIASIVLGGFYFASQISKQLSIEKQQQIELQVKKDVALEGVLEKEQEQEQAIIQAQEESATSASVNKCVTDAYAELKTLQNNFFEVYREVCTENPSSPNCSSEWLEKGKRDAFTRYENEWVPQCKLGNRVFTHYEPYTP